MTYEVTSVVTQAGITAAIDAGASGPQIDIVGFRIGSQSAADGAVALDTDTDVDGRVYDGDASAMQYMRVNDNTVAWRIGLAPDVGDFDVGQIGIIASGDVLFAKAVLPGKQQKWKSRPPTLIGDMQYYTILMTLTNVANLLNVTILNTMEATLPEVPTENDLPAPNSTPYNAYLVRNHTHIGQPCIAVRVNSAWTFSPHYTYPNVGLGVVAVTPSMFADSAAYGSAAAPAVGAVGWNKTLKQYVAADGVSLTEMPVGVRMSTYQVVTLGMVKGEDVGVSGTLVPGTPYYAGTDASVGQLTTDVNGPVIAVAVSATDLYVDTVSMWRASLASVVTVDNFIESNTVAVDVTADTLDADLLPGTIVYAHKVGNSRTWSRADPLDDANTLKRPVGMLNNDKTRVVLAGLVKITATSNDLPGTLTVGQHLACGGGADRGKVKAPSYVDSYIVGIALDTNVVSVRFNSIASLSQHLSGSRHDIVTTPYGVAQMISNAIAGISSPGAQFPLDYNQGSDEYYIHVADQASLGSGRAATDDEVLNRAAASGSNTPHPWLTPRQIGLLDIGGPGTRLKGWITQHVSIVPYANGPYGAGFRVGMSATAAEIQNGTWQGVDQSKVFSWTGVNSSSSPGQYQSLYNNPHAGDVSGIMGGRWELRNWFMTESHILGAFFVLIWQREE